MGKTSVSFLGETNIFAEAFPDIASFCIDYAETDGERQGSITAPSHFVGKIRCGNTRCKGGGYNLEHELRMMILHHIESQEATLYCPGREGSHPKAAPCSNALKLKMEITYISPNVRICLS